MRQAAWLQGIAVVLAGVLVTAGPGPVIAAGKKKDEQKREAPAIDVDTGKHLNAAIEALDKNRYDAARTALGKLKLDKLSPYERSRTEHLLALIDYGQDQYAGARRHFLAAIDAGGLNAQEIDQIRYTVAQLYMSEERWKEGAAALEDWFKTAATANSGAYYLLAVAYYQLGDTARALPPAKKAIELTDKPQPTWLQLLLALYLQREQYGDAIPLLERLIAAYPEKKDYWIQLVSIHGARENYPEALAVMQAAHTAGLLSEESEFQRLVDLLMVTGVPYRAAEVLAAAIDGKKVRGEVKSFEKLANCWLAAREYDKAVPSLQKAAQGAETGDLYVRLGEVEVQRERWAAAAEAFQRAFDKGRLKDPGNAELMMGIALYHQKKPQEALPWFQRARATEKQRKTASDYIRLIESQQG